MNESELQPLISIIVPVFNTACYLDECLESISRQTYTNWEALLIDDASTDGLSLTLCNEWARRDERFRIVALPQNKGIGFVRNKGVAMAQGALITFVDSDDFLSPNHIESLWKELNFSGKDIAVTGILQCTKEGHIRKRSFLFPKKGFQVSRKDALKALLMDRNLTSHLCNKLFKRDLFEGLFFPESRVYEDFALMLPLVERANGVVHTGIASYHYRRHNTSITRVASPKHLQDFFRANEERYIYLQKSNHFISEKERMLLRLWYRKTLLRLQYEARKLPASHERELVLEYMSKTLKALDIREITNCFRLRMLAYSLRKRYYEVLLR